MKKYIALTITVIILAGGAFLSQRWYVESFPTDNAPQQQKIVSEGDVTFTATTSSTVIEVMNALAAEGKLSFSGRDFPGLGFFVEEISGKKSESGYYWILLINGKKSDVGASSARVRPGDVIEWSYQEKY